MSDKISLNELNKLIIDLDTPEKDLRRYLVADDAHSRSLAPQIGLNPETVDIPDTPEGRARGGAMISTLNWASRVRRRRLFERHLNEGYDGPIIVAEGDSWFQYPWLLEDVIDHLKDEFAILSLDAAGDTLDNMAREREYIEHIAEQNASIFLLSAGGNDALGGGDVAQHLREFDPHLSAAGHLRPSFDGLIGHAMGLLDGMFRELEQFPELAVMCHGYDYAIPSNGKWLGDPMAKRGIQDAALQAEIVTVMVNRFNEELHRLGAQFPNVQVLDNRGVVKGRWSDELHPTDEGYADVAARFRTAIGAVAPRARTAVNAGPSPRRRRRRAYDATPSRSVAKPLRNGISLHIGLNFVDPGHYAGWDGELVACEFDAHDMEALAQGMGYGAVNKLLTKQATRDAVIAHIKDASSKLKSGDIFFVSYSGHGGQVPDMNGEEADSIDETWCLYDGQLIDDELYMLWTEFREGVRILVVSDSCHSGTVVRNTFASASAGLMLDADEAKPRAMPFSTAAHVFRQNRTFYENLARSLGGVDDEIVSRELSHPLAASVRLLSGCQDNQYSYDGLANGQFTGKLLHVWAGGTFTDNYKKFHQAISDQMPSNQSPNHLKIGQDSPAFDAQRPFEI